MPALGADMDTGTLVEWRVEVGDHVRKGDTIAVVDTDKSTIDVEVFETGIVSELLVAPGERVPVGAPLARIGEEVGPGAEHGTAAAGGAATGSPTPGTTEVTSPVSGEVGAPVTQIGTAPAVELGAPPTTAAVPPERPANEPQAPIVGGAGRHHASMVLSPVVRHLAERLGVDLDRVEGTGPGGRVTRHDVESAARSRVSPRARRLAAARGVDLDRLRGAGSGPGGAVVARDVDAVATRGPTRAEVVAPSVPRPNAQETAEASATPRRAMVRMMERSNREIPHFHVASTIDLEPAMTWLDDRNRDRPSGERIVPAALLLRAVAVAARGVPSMNGWWRDGEPVLASSVTVGMVVSLRGGGLLTPSLPEPDLCTLDELMDRLRGVVQRARRGSLRSSDTQAASLTVTNLGDRGAELVHGVIQPPQLALVGLGRIVERPWVHDGAVVPRRVVTASLAVDHRANDGHSASRFLSQLEQQLGAPSALAGDQPAKEPRDSLAPGGDDDGA